MWKALKLLDQWYGHGHDHPSCFTRSSNNFFKCIVLDTTVIFGVSIFFIYEHWIPCLGSIPIAFSKTKHNVESGKPQCQWVLRIKKTKSIESKWKDMSGIITVQSRQSVRPVTLFSFLIFFPSTLGGQKLFLKSYKALFLKQER